MKKKKTVFDAPPDFQRRHMSIRRFAQATDSKENTVRSWIFRGMIPVIRMGRSVRIPIEVAEKIISAGFSNANHQRISHFSNLKGEQND